MADDWESMMESGEVNADAKTFKGEEDAVITLEKPEEKKIESQPKNPEKEAKKKKEKDLEKRWEEKNKVVGEEKRGPLTAEELRKMEELSKKSDQKNAADLFGDIIKQQEDQELKSAEAYADYAKKVAAILVKEDRKKHIQEFLVTVLDAVSGKLSSTELSDITDKARTLFNKKQAEEKAAEKSGKGKEGPVVNNTKGAANINNTKNMLGGGFGDDDDEPEDDHYDAGDDFM